MQNGEYSIEDRLVALVKGVGYLTRWQRKSLFRRRHGEMSYACFRIALYRNGGHCLVGGRGWWDLFLLLLLWVQKSRRRQQRNRTVGKGNSRWGGKSELHLSRVLTGKFSMEADPSKKTAYSLWVWFCRFSGISCAFLWKKSHWHHHDERHP